MKPRQKGNKFSLVDLFLSRRAVRNKALGITYEIIYVPPHVLNHYKERGY